MARLRELWLRRPIATAIVAAALLMLPTFAIGFFCDDMWHVLMVEGGDPPPPGATGLYEFTRGGYDAQVQRIAQGGFFGWWTDPSSNVRFMRPLSSALTTMDHALFGRSSFGYKLHSWLWYLAVVFAVGLLHRRLAPPRVAALATLIFAIDDTHAQVASWIACRHALIATLPAVLGIIAHLKARESDFRAGRVLAPLAFVIAFTAGETAVPALLFVFAYEIAGAKDSLRARLVGSAPFAIVAAGYLVVYRIGRYGVRGSSAYIDPLGSPLAYGKAMPPRVAALAEDLIAGLSTELWSMEPSSRWVTVPLGVLALAALVVVTRAVASRRAADESRHVRWLMLAMLVALPPVASGFMGGRVLLVPSIASSLLVASVLVHGLSALRGMKRFIVRWLAVVHLVLAPANCLMVMFFERLVATESERAAQAVDPAASRVYTIGTSDPFVTLYTPYWVRLNGTATTWHALSIARHPHRLVRTSERALEITVLDGSLLETEYERVFRVLPIRAGAEIELASGRIRVLEANDVGPTRFVLESTVSLDEVHLLVWRGENFERMLLKTGESVDIPWKLGPSRF